MKSVSAFLLVMLALVPGGVFASPVSGTAGNNLTAYNPGMGSVNNNNWNSLTNPRSGGNAASAPTADFGNCNSLIMRCAQPKCSSGCTDGDVARGIVEGCVNSNAACKKHGAELVNYIVSQLVASSKDKENMAAAAANAAAAASQNDAQMQAVQAQMEQTQQMLAQQTAAMNALQSELNEQKQIAADAIAAANATASVTENVAPSGGGASYDTGGDSWVPPEGKLSEPSSTAERIAAESGVDINLLYRADISGQILTSIENAEKNLKQVEESMKAAFDYAGCDHRGSNCSGPRRVAVFKDKANRFFEPYENVVDQIYDALIQAQSVGVDVTNIYQYLNNSCQTWAKYMCAKPYNTIPDPQTKNKYLYTWPRYTNENCVNGMSVPNAEIYNEQNIVIGSVRGNMECSPFQTIPPEDDTSCTSIGILRNSDPDDQKFTASYLYPEEGDMGGMIRVGCISNVLSSSKLFASKKKQIPIDTQILQRMLNQDAHPVSLGVRRGVTGSREEEMLKYCAITGEQYSNLQKYAALRGLPKRNICINSRKLDSMTRGNYLVNESSLVDVARTECEKKTGAVFSQQLVRCFCEKIEEEKEDGTKELSQNCDETKSKEEREKAEFNLCQSFLKYAGSTNDKTLNQSDTNLWSGSGTDKSIKCPCDKVADDDTKSRCAYQFPDGNESLMKYSASEDDNSSSKKSAKQRQCDAEYHAEWDKAKGFCLCGKNVIDPLTEKCVLLNDGTTKKIEPRTDKKTDTDARLDNIENILSKMAGGK